MSTLAELITEPDDLLLDRNFYNVLESHIPFLKKDSGTTVMTISDLTASIYAGDFYGLLNHLGIDKKFHYIVLRINDLYSSSDYLGTDVVVLVPAVGLMNSIFILQNSKETT